MEVVELRSDAVWSCAARVADITEVLVVVSVRSGWGASSYLGLCLNSTTKLLE